MSVLDWTAALWVGWAAAAADNPQALADRAVDANPSLKALEAQEAALRSRADVAGAWTDPMLSMEYSNVPITTLSIGDHPMAGIQLRAEQTLRPPRWSSLHRTVGHLRADATGHATAEAALQLRATVERTWWVLARTRLLREVTTAHLARTDELVEAARIRYETGGIGQHAVLRMEVLRDTLEDELGDFARAETELIAALAQALADDATAPDSPTVLEAAPLPPEGDWIGVAELHRPLLQRLASEEEASTQSAALARAEAAPDVSVWAGYRLRTVETGTESGTDLVSVGLGVPLPAGSARRAQGERQAALSGADAARATHAASLDGITADMRAILARWERAHEKATTYGDTLIPGAQATLATTLADFSVGRADFASLFEAEVTLLQLERGRITAAVETHLCRADATAVLGVDPSEGP